MKKTIPLLFILLFCTSCTTEELELSVDSKKITIENAVKIATNARKEFFSNEQRANTQSAVVDANAIYCYEGRGTRSQSTDSLFYVVNFEDNGGFAIVNCDAAGEPLLGVSDCGHFNPYEEQENENFQFFVEQLIDYTSSVNSVSITPIGPITPPYNPPGVCPAKIDLQWGQGNVYGDSCSNNISGCVPTAGAMILAYYRQPTSFNITFGNQNDVLSLDWSEINKHKRIYTRCNESQASTTHSQISRLMAQIGHSILADYRNGVTVAYYDNLLSYLRTFNYECTDYQPFFNVNYKSYLDNNYILLVQGSSSTNAAYGHQWIMDGYQTKSTIMDLDGNATLTTYCHYNWGWDGNSNGYFVEGVFNCEQGTPDNTSWGTFNKNYRYYVKLSAVKYQNNH